MNAKYVNCNLCNSDDYYIIFTEGKAQIHRIVKFKNCGLMHANPQTTHLIEGKISYNDEQNIVDKQLEEELKDFTPEKNQYLKKQYIQQSDYNKVLDYFDNRKKGSLLEIGSYVGVFLKTAQDRGWEATGIEPFPLPRLYSEKTFGLNIISTSFEESELREKWFNVIVTFHTIEHIYNPR